MPVKMAEMKICVNCGESKALDEFNSRSEFSDGKRRECRDCQKEANRCYRQSIEGRAVRAFHQAIATAKKYPEFNIEVETSGKELAQLVEAFNGKCAYCAVKESEETGSFHVEHIIPTSRGGRNHISNIVISCGRCNAKKNNKPLSLFYAEYLPFRDDALQFILKYIARFSSKSIDEVMQYLIEDTEKWMMEKEKRNG